MKTLNKDVWVLEVVVFIAMFLIVAGLMFNAFGEEPQRMVRAYRSKTFIMTFHFSFGRCRVRAPGNPKHPPFILQGMACGIKTICLYEGRATYTCFYREPT